MNFYKMLTISLFMGLFLFSCKDYPGHKFEDGVKLSLKPSWGDLKEQDIIIGGDCHLDSINDDPGDAVKSHKINKNESKLKVIGWAAVSGKDGITTPEIALSLKRNAQEGIRRFAPVLKLKRPDVAEYFKNSASVDAGFITVIDLTNIKPGNYKLAIIQHKEGKSYKCQYGADIQVTRY